MIAIGYGQFRGEMLRFYQHKSPGAYLKVRLVLDILEGLGMSTTADLTTSTAMAFVASRGMGANPNTTIGLLSYLKAMANYAVEEGWLDRPPSWRRVWPSAAPPLRKKDLTPDQVESLLRGLKLRSDEWQGHRLYALTGLILLTGLRRDEAMGLTIEDLDLAGGYLRVRRGPGRRLKTSAAANTVPLPDQATALLRPWAARCGPDWLFPGVERRGPWRGGAPGYRSIDHLKAAGRAVGIPWLSWHALRHTFATIAVRDWGLPLWLVQRILRHTSQRTTEGYLSRDDTPRLVELVRGCGYPLAA